MGLLPRMSSKKEVSTVTSAATTKQEPSASASKQEPSATAGSKQEPSLGTSGPSTTAPATDPPETKDDDEFSALPVDDWIEDMGDGPLRVCCQSLVPLIIGGLGSISAGLILNIATTLVLVKKIPQFVAVVPPIQGMKGNLDMTFTSRLTTIAAKGLLDEQPDDKSEKTEKSSRLTLIFRNVALLEAQGILFSLFVTLVSFLMDLPRRSPLGCAYNVYFFLGSVTVLAVFTSCCIMNFLMVGLVLLARRYKLNPDNMATPFASSLGDLASLGLMLGFFYALFPLVEQRIYISYTIIALMLSTVPLWYWLAVKDKEAHTAAKSQWCTLLVAAVVTSGAGILLEMAAEKYPDITAYQPLISGIAGNRAALMATRLSTILKIHHVSYLPLSTRINPISYYFVAKSKETQTARMLLLTSTFFQLFFVLVSHSIALLYNPLKLSVGMMLGYLAVAFVQVFILLFISQLVVTLLWRYKIDPDTHAIPIVTALGDLMGISLLLLLFFMLGTFSKDSINMGIVTANNSTTIGDTSAASNCSLFQL